MQVPTISVLKRTEFVGAPSLSLLQRSEKSTKTIFLLLYEVQNILIALKSNASDMKLSTLKKARISLQLITFFSSYPNLKIIS